MMKLGRRGSMLCGVAALLGSVGAGVLVAAPAGAATPKLYVTTGGSDTNNTCRLAAHPCATIAHAVSVAPSGGQISVGAGAFNTPLAISQSLSIVGTVQSGAIATTLKPSSTVPDTDSTYENAQPQTIGALIDVTNGASVSLSNLSINGASASASFDSTGCQDNFVGVYYHNASGSLSNVTVKGIELEPSLFGCQDGLAVYAATDAGSPTGSSVTMSGVTVKTYDKNGITCSDPGTSCSVAGSTVTGIGATSAIAQNGVQLGFGASGTITGTTITGDSYTGGGTDNQATGILVYDSAATTVSNNTLSANDINIFAGADSGAVAGDWSITGNAVSGATDNVTNGNPGNGEGNGYGDGIQIDGVGGTNPTSVSTNTSSSNYEYGIALYSTSSATVSSNVANTNYDGIYVDSASSGNTVNDNTTKHNTRYDLEDLSTGGGTAGTADTWTGNTCKPAADSTPEGLC